MDTYTLSLPRRLDRAEQSWSRHVRDIEDPEAEEIDCRIHQGVDDLIPPDLLGKRIGASSFGGRGIGQIEDGECSLGAYVGPPVGQLNQIRGSGLAVSGFAQWIANFGITMTFPIMLASIGLTGAYGFYAASAAVSVVFVWMLVRETKGIELEDMQG